MNAITRDPRWTALITRDRGADGSFYYSVKTTGVYCRPSCASRQPKPENVRFHATTAEAEAAGFRPCKRCKPDQLSAPGHAAKIAGICRLIETAEEPPRLADLAEQAGLSPFHFHRLFKEATGVTPAAYARAHRAEKLRHALRRGDSVTTAMYDAGFNSSGPFYAGASGTLGMTPRQFKQGGTAATIHFALGECSLGSVLAACSEIGVCAILLGDNPEELLQDLQDRFPRAQLIGGDADFEGVVAQVVGLVDTPTRGFALPLDIQGTAFQQRVWQVLRTIPAGQTASYAEIAERLSEPNAVRAVAGACAANKLAVAIPCHRVVRTDGALSGYRWGVERKRALLAREAELTA